MNKYYNEEEMIKGIITEIDKNSLLGDKKEEAEVEGGEINIGGSSNRTNKLIYRFRLMRINSSKRWHKIKQKKNKKINRGNNTKNMIIVSKDRINRILCLSGTDKKDNKDSKYNKKSFNRKSIKDRKGNKDSRGLNENLENNANLDSRDSQDSVENHGNKKNQDITDKRDSPDNKNSIENQDKIDNIGSTNSTDSTDSTDNQDKIDNKGIKNSLTKINSKSTKKNLELINASKTYKTILTSSKIYKNLSSDTILTRYSMINKTNKIPETILDTRKEEEVKKRYNNDRWRDQKERF